MPLLKFNKSADKMHYYWHAMEPVYFLIILAEIGEIQEAGFGINVIDSLLRFVLFIIVMYALYRYKRSRPIIEFSPQKIIIRGKQYAYSDIECIHTKPGDIEDESAFLTISAYFLHNPKIIPHPNWLFLGREFPDAKVCPSRVFSASIASSQMLYVQLKENTPFKFRKRKGYYFDLDNDFTESDAHALLENFKKHHIKNEKCDTHEICMDKFLDIFWNIGKYFLISVFILGGIDKFLALFFD